MEKRIDQLKQEEEQASQSSLKCARVGESEIGKIQENCDTEALKQKKVILGKEMNAKNTKIKNKVKQLKEHKDIVEKLKEMK